MIHIYDSGYRGECRSERCEQIDSMSWLGKHYPERYALIFHCPNETRAGAQHMQMRAKEGVKAGVSDIIDLAGPIIGIFEMKRMDKRKCKFPKEQRDFLEASDAAGYFACLCYGFEQFKLAYADHVARIKALT